MSAPADRDDARATFRDLAAHLARDGLLRPGDVALLEFTGRCLGIPSAERPGLARTGGGPPPSGWAAGDLAARVEAFLVPLPAAQREDVRRFLAARLGTGDDAGAPPPCPTCRASAEKTTRPLWSPPAGRGLSRLEGTRRSLWRCLGCGAVIECVDEHGDRRTRRLVVCASGSDLKALAERAAAVRDRPEDLAALLAAGPLPGWLWDRIPEVGTAEAFGAPRAAVAGAPAETPAVYGIPDAGIHLGLPPTPAHWRHLLAAAPAGTLADLAAWPGVPPAVLAELLAHPDPAVRYSALLSPDVPAARLEAALKDGPPAEVLAVLDRGDVGPATLATALRRGDPHVLYRVRRHPGLNLILLEEAREQRRSRAPDGELGCHCLQLYAPRPAGAEGGLLAALYAEIRAGLDGRGWAVGPPGAPPDPGGRGVELELVQVTTSRAILFLAPPEDPAPDLDYERLPEALARACLARLAREILTLRVDERAGFWDARVYRPDRPARRVGARDLPRPPAGACGRWLEFELFCAERALPFPGLPAAAELSLLATRPPYADARDTPAPRLRFRVRPRRRVPPG